MSKPERRSPAAGDGRAPKCIAVAANAPEHKPQSPNLQQRRALWLARHARIAPAMAETIAPMVFGGEGIN